MGWQIEAAVPGHCTVEIIGPKRGPAGIPVIKSFYYKVILMLLYLQASFGIVSLGESGLDSDDVLMKREGPC